MKKYRAFAESSSGYALELQANSEDEAWEKAEEAAENGQFKEVPMSGEFKVYDVVEIEEENGPSAS
tara:strand:+ start:931 stop:1128 length:198 start_codon:yes stop_codon:yes gene_type:complete